MSTRRARIKAVAALPPRRKNLANADTKNKQKEHFEKSVKSPRTPRGVPGKNEENNTPAGKNEEKNTSAGENEENNTPAGKNEERITPAGKNEENNTPAEKNEEKNSLTGSAVRIPPALLPLNSVYTSPAPDDVPSYALTTSDNMPHTPRSDTVGVITPTSQPATVIRNISSNAKNSPNLKEYASLVPSPMPISIDPSQKSATPKVATALIEISDKSIPSTDASQSTENVATPSAEEKNDIPNDYSVPSIPESLADESVMDGIVPLQSACSVPQPMDLLKNEMMSENSEVLFDPIVPLPSPSKVRPKLRPVPRLAPHRRNSVQGSASESEDESRRSLISGGATSAPPRQRHDSHTSHSTVQHTAPNKEVNRIRNDSISSSVSQATGQPATATSPVKEKHCSNKARRQEMSRRGYRHRKDTKRETLTMYDLIFYNPTSNPIIPDEEEVLAKEANAKEAAERQKEEAAKESEEDADDPPAAEAAPVPQIKLGPNGEIILDEKSLVIKQSDANRQVSSVIREGSWAGAGGGRYTRAARTAEWNMAETIRFYRALGAVGTDFTLMAHLFPDRKRRDLYLKFKKEERNNGAQVDKALRSATAWDPEQLMKEFTQEREEAARKAEEERKILLQRKEEERERLKSLREMRRRYSRGSKAIESAMVRNADRRELTGDEFFNRTLEARKKKRPEPEFILPTTAPAPAPAPMAFLVPQVQPKPQPPPFATLTLLGGPTLTLTGNPTQDKPQNEMATIKRIDTSTAAPTKPVSLNEVSGVPSNIEAGSLVVLRVNDPKDPSKTMLQTYISSGTGKLTPVALPATFLNSVVGYMKKDASKESASPSPQLTSPSSVASDRSCTPGVIQLNPSPNKRQRHSSYSITPL